MKELYAKLKIRTSLFVQEKLDALSQIFGMEYAEIPYFQLAYNGNFKKSDNVTTDEKIKGLGKFLLMYLQSITNLLASTRKVMHVKLLLKLHPRHIKAE